jgi:hypothetical protein
MGANPNQYQTGADSLNTPQIAVGTSNPAIQLVAANPTRRAVTITNASTNNVFIGTSNAVATTTGDLLAGIVGATKTYCVTCALYAISGSNSTVTVAEEYDAGGP